MSSSANKNSGKSENVGKKYYVRYMLSLRCKKTMNEELKKLNTKFIILPYSAVEFPDGIEQKKVDTFKRNLRKSGLDLLNQHESLLVDKIISMIIEVIHEFDDLPNLTYSEIISKNITDVGESVLKIFTEVVGMSVIQFILIHKIDRIKEFLLYENFSLSEISKKLNYKSEEDLIAQFKKYTGLTPEHFLKLKDERNKIIAQSNQKSKENKSVKKVPVG